MTNDNQKYLDLVGKISNHTEFYDGLDIKIYNSGGDLHLSGLELAYNFDTGYVEYKAVPINMDPTTGKYVQSDVLLNVTSKPKNSVPSMVNVFAHMFNKIALNVKFNRASVKNRNSELLTDIVEGL